jgi:putative LysE/RhtB family amino acid efflux pump
MASAALHGFGLGFVIALTPGPMFFLCLRRTLGSGWRAGLATGLGIATADGIYAALAAGGIGALDVLVGGSARWIELAGGSALVILGLRTLLPTPVPDRAPAATRLGGGYLSALALTLANPATIVSFGAIFAAVGVRSPVTVAATALGSLSWWVLLVTAATHLSTALGERAAFLRWASGLALLAFGLVAVLGALLR